MLTWLSKCIKELCGFAKMAGKWLNSHLLMAMTNLNCWLYSITMGRLSRWPKRRLGFLTKSCRLFLVTSSLLQSSKYDTVGTICFSLTPRTHWFSSISGFQLRGKRLVARMRFAASPYIKMRGKSPSLPWYLGTARLVSFTEELNPCTRLKSQIHLISQYKDANFSVLLKLKAPNRSASSLCPLALATTWRGRSILKSTISFKL